MMRSDFLRSSAPYRRSVTYKLRKEKLPTRKKAKSLTDTLLFLPPSSIPTHHPLVEFKSLNDS